MIKPALTLLEGGRVDRVDARRALLVREPRVVAHVERGRGERLAAREPVLLLERGPLGVGVRVRHHEPVGRQVGRLVVELALALRRQPGRDAAGPRADEVVRRRDRGRRHAGAHGARVRVVHRVGPLEPAALQRLLRQPARLVLGHEPRPVRPVHVVPVAGRAGRVRGARQVHGPVLLRRVVAAVRRQRAQLAAAVRQLARPTLARPVRLGARRAARAHLGHGEARAALVRRGSGRADGAALHLPRRLDDELDAVGALVVHAAAAHRLAEVLQHGPRRARQVAQVAVLALARHRQAEAHGGGAEAARRRGAPSAGGRHAAVRRRARVAAEIHLFA